MMTMMMMLDDDLWYIGQCQLYVAINEYAFIIFELFS